jgi:hypothetical protein
MAESVEIVSSSQLVPFSAVQITNSKAGKKRKAVIANLSSATNSDNENANSSQNSAYYLQKAVDNLKLAYEKEVDQAKQQKIKLLTAKVQLIFLNFADLVDVDSESESSSIQNDINSIKSDMNNRFNQILSLISDLKSVTTAAAFQNLTTATTTDIAMANSTTNSTASSSQSVILTDNLTDNLTGISQNSMQNSGNKTYAQALRSFSQSSIENQADSSILHNAENLSANSARSKSKTQFNAKNNEKSRSNSNSKSFSYKERRLILLNSQNTALSAADSMKLRDKINKDFQNELKLSATELVLAAIVKSYKQQNIVLMTMSNYNADFLIQHQNIWQNNFEFSGFLQDKTWHKVVAHGIPTEIFNFSKGLDLLKEEIKIFNGIQPVAVNWLSSSQNREQKKHASIVIAFDNKIFA